MNAQTAPRGGARPASDKRSRPQPTARPRKAQGALRPESDDDDTRDTLPPPAENERDPAPDLDDFADIFDGLDDSDGEDFDEEEEERLSRAQLAREDDDIHEGYQDDWEAPRLLDAPEPRPGYVQRWIRVAIGNDNDRRNLAQKARQGWRPRNPDTVPKAFPVPTIAHGKVQAIQVEGLVLMERPTALHKRQARAVRGKTQRLESAVEATLASAHQPGKGFGRPTRKVESHVERGRRRPVDVADDDE